MNLSAVATTIALVAGLVGIASGYLAIKRYLNPEKRGTIDNPPSQAQNGGRYLTIIGHVNSRRHGCAYWLAIQPSDCRGAGVWWPQGGELKLESDGAWYVQRATLGRDGAIGERDIGKTYTIALIEVPVSSPLQAEFKGMAAKGERLMLRSDFKILDSVEVERVHY
jgi:hypothetical protein